MKARQIKYLALFAGLLAYWIYPACAAERRVEINKVLINQITVDEKFFDELALSPRDTIRFYFECIDETEERAPMLFNVTLMNSAGDKHSKPWNPKSIQYHNLYEGEYTFLIFAYSDDWSTDTASVDFLVDRKKGPEMREKYIKAEKKAEKKKEKAEEKPEESESGLDTTSILIGLIVGIGSLGIILFIFALINRKKEKSSNNTKEYEPMSNETVNAVSGGDVEKLIIENSNLRAEVAALRGQIDALQSRGEDLKEQNNTLKEQVEKLSESQKEVLELQQQKDDLFAVIIHDIKNPAALIKSLIDLLRSYDLSATEQQEVIDDIFETTTKIVSLSQEMTKILALEGTTLQLNLQPNQMNDILKLVHRRNTIAAKGKEIELLLDLQDDIPESLMDGDKIDEVIDNLTSNAIKFSHKGGMVRIKSYMDENIIKVEVSDNGLGLSQEDIQQAFQKGTKLSAQPTAGENSSGFGLWIVKKLIEAHGGNVEVKSQLGKGSTFIVEMPYIDIEKANRDEV